MAVAEELKVIIKADAKKAQTDLQKLEKQTDKVSGSFTGLNKIMGAVGIAMTAGVLARGFAQMARSAIQAAADIQKITVSFEVLLGSASAAESLMANLQAFSAKTPFQLTDLTGASSMLLATGTAAKDLTAKLEQLGNAAQGDAAKFSQLADAFAKTQAKGKATLEEINRFTEAGVPLLDQLAENLNMSRQELFKFIETGKLGFGEVERALESLTTGEGQFAGMIEKQSETLNGAISTLKDNITLLGAAYADDMVPAMTGVVESLTNITIWARENERTIKDLLMIAANFGSPVGVVTSIGDYIRNRQSAPGRNPFAGRDVTGGVNQSGGLTDEELDYLFNRGGKPGVSYDGFGRVASKLASGQEGFAGLIPPDMKTQLEEVNNIMGEGGIGGALDVWRQDITEIQALHEDLAGTMADLFIAGVKGWDAFKNAAMSAIEAIAQEVIKKGILWLLAQMIPGATPIVTGASMLTSVGGRIGSSAMGGGGAGAGVPRGKSITQNITVLGNVVTEEQIYAKSMAFAARETGGF